MQLETLICSQRCSPEESARDSSSMSSFGSELEPKKSISNDYEDDFSISISPDDPLHTGRVKQPKYVKDQQHEFCLSKASPLHVFYANSSAYIPSIASIIGHMQDTRVSFIDEIDDTENNSQMLKLNTGLSKNEKAIFKEESSLEIAKRLILRPKSRAQQYSSIVKSFSSTVKLGAYSLERFRKEFRKLLADGPVASDSQIALSASAVRISNTISIDGSTLSNADTIISTIKFEEKFPWPDIKSDQFRFSRTRILLWLLLTHEIDRLIVWHNPSSNAALKFPNEDLFSCEFLLDAMSRRLKSEQLIEAAWSVNPRLALRLVQRFPIASLQYEWAGRLENKVRTEPQSVYRFPQSLMFLLTEKNVKEDIPELHHLMYFKESSIPFALSLLVEPFASHELVNQFAIRSLQSHTSIFVDIEVFYF